MLGRAALVKPEFPDFLNLECAGRRRCGDTDGETYPLLR